MDASTEGNPRRSSSASSSALEFQFWAAGESPPQLLTADELFADGILLPLHTLSLRPIPHPDPDVPPVSRSEPEPEPASDPPPPPPDADITASISCSPTSGSKRWKDIFRIGEKKPGDEKDRRKERRAGAAAAAAELNIHIWPFSRSRSAGSAAAGGVRPRTSISGRRVSSAPCSRSNSRGESSKPHAATAVGGRRWASSPGRASGGVPVGRSSPVWQIRRAEHRKRDKGTFSGRRATAGADTRVLHLSVNTCIGYRGSQRGCRGDDKDGMTARERTAGESSRTLFSLKALFSKKVN
ncbi:cyclin-dependent kinase 13-like [Zingiber officinale]|uniref:Uncharacterized protein n=1 Tax=Zingiber officinale TaxID=94328 RepID=A0A8J5I6E3_ZINOF|nr:cyclin-dependent kinase 13-like [Zingiber officinale]KAG6528430.1 hypothetical protein ZIOFF_010604 [Zingiber officinale]